MDPFTMSLFAKTNFITVCVSYIYYNTLKNKNLLLIIYIAFQIFVFHAFLIKSEK